MGRIKIPAEEYEISFSRSSGTGGQNVNKVNTKATLRWNALNSPSLSPSVLERFKEKYGKRLNEEGSLTLSSQAFRTQHLNISDVINKLHEMIESVETPPKIRKPTKPTKGSVKQRLNTKKSHGDKKKNRSKVSY
jgi:ribosome-associated protein